MAPRTRQGGRDVTVGAFAALAVIVLAFAIMAVGGESRLFGKKMRYTAVFVSSDGLVVGSPVKMAGVQVGTVVDVRLPTDPGAEGIEVALGVERAYAPRVREDSKASLRFLQYLSGEKYVEVTPGDPAAPELPPGALIPTNEAAKLLEQGQDIADNLNEITVAVREILAPIRRGEGLIGEALRDPNFGREGLQAIRHAAENLEALTARLNSGQGFAGRLLVDPALAPRADDLARAISGVAQAIERLAAGEGAAGDLLSAHGRSSKALDDLAEASASLRHVSARLASKEGLIGRLLNDTAYSDAVATDLRETLAHLNSVAGKIDRGEGSLGALVNERTLHDGLEDVASGVGDSRFARWLLRHYQKKGIKTDEALPKSP
jgi:phospholipid/cholesterol/gamma-HCH transport system substrate-binding protein